MDIVPLEANAATSLASAMMASIKSPTLLLDGDLKIVSASSSFCREFHVPAASMDGMALSILGGGEWNVPQLASLLHATIDGNAHQIDAYEMDLKRVGRATRCLVINVTKLVYSDKANVRLLMTVSDVTEDRFNKRFTAHIVEEKNLLLEELQHRVANSLQIIASVLMQSARRVASEESRSHLEDAHHRVMSVASLQRHLVTSKMEDVHLRTYLTNLCNSIGASMIHDRNQLSLEVHTDESIVGADASMSLGLMVTELVINAIKHAFPDGRKGKIMVGYRAVGLDWALSVEDDGIGMAVSPALADAGLGTSIVEALAKQQKAKVHVLDANPGVIVSVVHSADGEQEDLASRSSEPTI